MAGLKKRKKWFYMLLVIVFYIVCAGLNPPQGLTPQGWKAILLMLATVVVWMTECVPLGISSCFVLVLPQILGIQSTTDTLTQFATSTLLFILSSMMIAKVFVKVGLGNRISMYVTTIFGTKAKYILLAYMLCACLISAVLVDIPTVIICSGMAYGILEKNRCKPGQSNFGKAIMLGIPISAAVGGFATPAGSGINLLAQGLMKSVANVSITFTEWTMIGFPMALILTFCAWKVLLIVFKPEINVVSGLEDLKEERKKLGKLSKEEKKFSCIFLLTIVLWFTQQYTGIETAFASLLATTIFFLPGVDLLKWDEAQKSVSWETFLLVGSCNAMAMILATQGAAKWISDTFLGRFAAAGLVPLLFIVTAFGIFIHLIVPLSGAVLSMCIPIVAVLAQSAGINPLFLCLPLAYTASCVFLLPLDPITLANYQYGYWKMTDCPKVGVIVAIIWIPVAVVLLLAAHALGIF